MRYTDYGIDESNPLFADDYPLGREGDAEEASAA